MANPTLVPFRAEHLLSLQYTSEFLEDTITLAIRHERSGPAFTAIHSGRIMGCAGVWVQHGIGVAWTVMSKELLAEFPLWTTRTIRDVMRDITRAFDLRRMEMLAFQENVAWAELLGFQREVYGIARCYSPDMRSMIRLEKVNE